MNDGQLQSDWIVLSGYSCTHGLAAEGRESLLHNQLLDDGHWNVLIYYLK